MRSIEPLQGSGVWRRMVDVCHGEQSSPMLTNVTKERICSQKYPGLPLGAVVEERVVVEARGKRGLGKNNIGDHLYNSGSPILLPPLLDHYQTYDNDDGYQTDDAEPRQDIRFPRNSFPILIIIFTILLYDRIDRYQHIIEGKIPPLIRHLKLDIICPGLFESIVGCRSVELNLVSFIVEFPGVIHDTGVIRGISGIELYGGVLVHYDIRAGIGNRRRGFVRLGQGEIVVQGES